MEECKKPPVQQRVAELAKRWNEAADRYTQGERRAIYDFTDEEKETLNKSRESRKNWQRLAKDRGKRYENCQFSNYISETDQQKKAVQQLVDYYENSIDRVANGENVILFGPKGSGKDHLLMALALEVAKWSLSSTTWVNGVDLIAEFRARSMGECERHISSRRDDYFTCDVLWISDPLPPTGVLTEFQQAEYFRLLDKRYSAMRPTWVSVNCASGSELESRMGAQSADRLRHGALAIHCHWPSYRTEQASK